VAVGSGAALADGAFSPLPALCALLGAMLIQVGTNLTNDYSDFQKGADGKDRLGPARAAAHGWLSTAQVRQGAILAFALAATLGGYLIATAGWPILVVGIASIAAGVAYTAGPWPLAYLGLGDVFVLVFFGPVAVGGAYFVQAHAVCWRVLILSLAVGLLAGAILVVNNLRDRHTDARVGKRTLAVRLGERFSRWLYVAFVTIAYAIPTGLWLTGEYGHGLLLPLVTMPMAVKTTRRLLVRDGASLNPLLGDTARLGLFFSVAMAIGLGLGRWLGTAI